MSELTKDERMELRKVEIKRALSSMEKILEDKNWGEDIHKDNGVFGSAVIPELKEVWVIYIRPANAPDCLWKNIDEENKP